MKIFYFGEALLPRFFFDLKASCLETKINRIIAIWNNILICSLNDRIHRPLIKRRFDKKRESSSFSLLAFSRNPHPRWRHLRGPVLGHAIFIRVSLARWISREEREREREIYLSYVYIRMHLPDTFRTSQRETHSSTSAFCVSREMSPSRIESLCRDTFARCVIRSLLLLVKELYRRNRIRRRIFSCKKYVSMNARNS